MNTPEVRNHIARVRELEDRAAAIRAAFVLNDVTGVDDASLSKLNTEFNITQRFITATKLALADAVLDAQRDEVQS